MRERVGQQPLGLARVQVLGRAEHGSALPGLPGLILDAFQDLVDLRLHHIGIEDGLHIQIIEDLARLGRVEHVTGLVDAKLFEDDRQFLLQDLADTVFDRVLEHEVDSAYRVRLTDAVHPADALLQAHWIPGNVVVDNYMAELEVETLTTGVRRDEDGASLANASWTRLRSSMSMEPLRHTTGKPRSVRNSYSISWVGTNSVNTSTLRSGSPSSAWRR